MKPASATPAPAGPPSPRSPRTKTPHSPPPRPPPAPGLARAIPLTHSLPFNADAVPDAVARIGGALGDDVDAPGAIDRLRERIGLPGHLSECGVSDEDIDAVVRQIGGNHNVQMNPK